MRLRVIFTFIVIAAIGAFILYVAAPEIVKGVKAVTSQQTAYFQFDSVLPTTRGESDAADRIG